MGECGCADFNVQFKFKGPDNTYYLLAMYDSCEYCDTPAGFILYRMNGKEMREWGVEDMPATEIGYEGKVFAVLHPKILRDMMIKDRGVGRDDDLGIDIEDAMTNCFREAIWATRKEGEGS